MLRLYPIQDELVKTWIDPDIVSTSSFTKWLVTRAMQMSGRLEEARAVYDTDESFKEHIRLHPIQFDACLLGDFFAITNKLRLRYNALSPEDTTASKQKMYIKLCTNSLKAIGSCNNKITTIIKADLTALHCTECAQFLNWLRSIEKPA